MAHRGESDLLEIQALVFDSGGLVLSVIIK